MTFQECCIQCAGNAELVKEFNRLSDAKLGESRNPFEIAIDNASGYEPNNEEDLQKFCDFVYRCVWAPLLAQQEKDLN